MDTEKEKEQPAALRKIKRDKKWELALGAELNQSRSASRLVAVMSFLALCFSAWLIMLSSLPPSKGVFGCLLVSSFLWVLSGTVSLGDMQVRSTALRSLLEYASPQGPQGLKAHLPSLAIALFSLGMLVMFCAFIAARMYVNSTDPFAS